MPFVPIPRTITAVGFGSSADIFHLWILYLNRLCFGHFSWLPFWTIKTFGAIDPLMDFNPAYINVTFHREALKEDVRPDGSREWHIMRRRPGTVGISAAIRRKYDVEVVPHLICGGWSKYDIEDSLIDMDFLARAQRFGQLPGDLQVVCHTLTEKGPVIHHGDL